MSLTDSELKELANLAETRPRLAKRLTGYRRHVQRIRTLERVLDPKDAAAVGNTTTGSAETYQLEIDRRRGEAAKLEIHLKAAITPRRK